jgi:hypothetical protein
LEGGEAGLRQIEGNIFTDPSKAETFLKEYVLCIKSTLNLADQVGLGPTSSLHVSETDTALTSLSKVDPNPNGILSY